MKASLQLNEIEQLEFYSKSQMDKERLKVYSEDQ